MPLDAYEDQYVKLVAGVVPVTVAPAKPGIIVFPEFHIVESSPSEGRYQSVCPPPRYARAIVAAYPAVPFALTIVVVPAAPSPRFPLGVVAANVPFGYQATCGSDVVVSYQPPGAASR